MKKPHCAEQCGLATNVKPVDIKPSQVYPVHSEAATTYHVVPILTPTEADPGLRFLPPRVDDSAIHHTTYRVKPGDFPGNRYPAEITGLIREAKRRGFRAHVLSWCDHTRCLVVFPKRHRTLPANCAVPAYRRARQLREQLLLERVATGD